MKFMKIYVTHASSYDYEAGLYTPLKESQLFDAHEFFLPHDGPNIAIKTTDIIDSFDLMVCEVSHASTGQGIEIGLATAAQVPVVCFYHEGSRPSGALKFYSREIRSYTDSSDLIAQLTGVLKAHY
jgi:hypothetical protein